MLGSGTEADPYQVATAEDLDAVRNNLTAYYIQTANITLDEEWVPIGDFWEDILFDGHYDGNGYIIYNLSITNPHSFEEYFVGGLFAYTSDISTLSNITLINVNINVPNCDCTGALAGYNSATVTNCKSSGSVEGYCSLGGLIGYNDGKVTKCSSSCSVTGIDCVEEGYEHDSFWVGGLIGYDRGETKQSFSEGNVKGTDEIGGFVGITGYYNIYDDCYALGAVESNLGSDVGGFVGRASSNMYNSEYCTIINNCYSKGLVTGGSLNIGGFCGRKYPYAYINNCYYDSQTSGQSDTGKGEPKTTAEMKTQSTFNNWDFVTIWQIVPTINSGYPSFRGVVVLPITRKCVSKKFPFLMGNQTLLAFRW